MSLSVIYMQHTTVVVPSAKAISRWFWHRSHFDEFWQSKSARFGLIVLQIGGLAFPTFVTRRGQQG